MSKKIPRINQKFMRAYLDDQDCGRIFAKSETIFGEFFLEGMEIRINISEDDLVTVEEDQKLLIQIKENPSLIAKYKPETIESAKGKISTFMQVHNHEFAHLYQVLALPAFQLVWVTRHNLLRLEAVVMLRYFEEDGRYICGKHEDVLQILNENTVLQKEFGVQFNEICGPYNYYREEYKKLYNGISLFYIIESMAHVVSLQLSENPDIDVLNIGSTDEYSKAFLFFESKIRDTHIETRWKCLLFVYICYFSCHEFGTIESPANPVVLFFRLCDNAPFFLEELKKYHAYYTGFTRSELKDMNSWGVSEDEIEFSSTGQLVSILSFFKTIDLIDGFAFPNKDMKKSLDIESLRDFISASNNININWGDKYILARMLIFPFNYVWLRDIYDSVMENKGRGKEFTYAQEAEFYRFIMNCKHLLDKKAGPIVCCPVHGIEKRNKKIVSCTNEGGLGFYISTLTGKPARNLFIF